MVSPTIGVVFLVLLSITVILLFLPVNWRRREGYPGYKLSDALLNEYTKKKHEWFRVPLDVEQCHDNMVQVHEVFTQVGITRWWLSEGTALGLKRSGQLIPWDDDVDIFLDGYQRETFMKYAVPLLRKRGFIHVLNDAKIPMLSFVRKGEKVDFSFLESGQTCSAGMMPCAELEPLVQVLEPVVIRGLTFYIPSQEEYYVALYGPQWRVPNRKDKSEKGNRSKEM